jgi:hypothetical protein
MNVNLLKKKKVVPGDFKAWSSFAADRKFWREVCGTKQHSPTQVLEPWSSSSSTFVTIASMRS